MNKCFRLGLASAILVKSVGFVLAAGYDLPDQDAFAAGRGMAVVATADNPSAIYFNPAGITQMQGHNLRIGIYGIDLEPSYKSPSGGSYDNIDKLHAISQFYYTYNKPEAKWGVGLGMYSPFGLGTKWPQDTGFRTVGTEGAITTMALNPVIAFKLSPTLSVAGGVLLNFAMADLRQGLLSPTTPTDGFRFDGDGWDVTYNLGILWQPTEKVSIGGSFRSGTSIRLNGHTEDYGITPTPERTSAHGNLPLPYKIICGISYRPNPQWNFEFDADYKDWNSATTVVIQQTQPTVLSGVVGGNSNNQDFILPLNWQSSWYYEFGATRYLDNGWHISGGYIFNENSVPNANYTPTVADLDRHFFSIGVGRKGKKYDFDIAYQFGYGPTSQVTGSAPSLAGQTADGKYDYISHAVAVSWQWHF